MKPVNYEFRKVLKLSSKLEIPLQKSWGYFKEKKLLRSKSKQPKTIIGSEVKIKLKLMTSQYSYKHVPLPEL